MKINTIVELKEICLDTSLDCYILLNGSIRSSKVINYDPITEKFTVLNEIDFSEQVLTESELFSESLIGDAVLAGALYTY